MSREYIQAINKKDKDKPIIQPYLWEKKLKENIKSLIMVCTE